MITIYKIFSDKFLIYFEPLISNKIFVLPCILTIFLFVLIVIMMLEMYVSSGLLIEAYVNYYDLILDV